MKAPLPQVELDYDKNIDETEYKAKNPCKNPRRGRSPKREKFSVFFMSITKRKHFYNFPEFWDNDIYSENVPNLLKQWDRCLIVENF